MPRTKRAAIKRLYIVYRHGSNAANQHMTLKMVVGSVEAATGTEACYLMMDSGKVLVFNNQYLSATAWNSAPKADQIAASEVEDPYAG